MSLDSGADTILRDHSQDIAHTKSRASRIAREPLRSQSSVAFAKSKDPIHNDTIQEICNGHQQGN